MHGCGWDSGSAIERSSALAASVASRFELGADGVGAARPGARGSRVTASRYALGAEGGGAARPGAYMCPPRNCARTESPTTHYCTVQHHVPIAPYAERMPRANCSSNTIRDSISRVAPSLRGPPSARACAPPPTRQSSAPTNRRQASSCVHGLLLAGRCHSIAVQRERRRPPPHAPGAARDTQAVRPLAPPPRASPAARIRASRGLRRQRTCSWSQKRCRWATRSKPRQIPRLAT